MLSAYRWIMVVLVSLAFAAGSPTTSRGQSLGLHAAGKLPVALDLHGSAVVGKRYYVFGGKKAEAWNKQAWSAELRDNATLGEWRSEPDLPEFRTHIGPLVEVVNDRIYILGGLTVASEKLSESAISTAKTALWTRVNPDGTLAGWQTSASFDGQQLSNGAATADETHVYLLGGKLATIGNRVLVGDLGEDGAPQQWRVTTPMPTPLWGHGSAVLDGRMFVWGGRPGEDDNVMNENVYMATVGKDGNLGEWQVLGTMSTPLGRGGFLGFNDHLICVGGLKAGGLATNEITFTRLAGGAMEPWKLIQTDLAGKMYVSVTEDKQRGWVLASGGRVGATDKEMGAKNVVDGVQLFRVTQAAQQRLVVDYTAGAAATRGSSAEVPVVKFEQALQSARSSGKAIVLYAYSSEVPACKRLWGALMSTSAFANATADRLVSAIDINGVEGPNFCYQLGVFKVPAFAIVKPDGTLDRKLIGPGSAQEVLAFLGQK